MDEIKFGQVLISYAVDRTTAIFGETVQVTAVSDIAQWGSMTTE